jgi:arginyl-tRNA synthetase
LSDDGELSAARLALVEATQIVLRRVLGLLGVAAPERM